MIGRIRCLIALLAVTLLIAGCGVAAEDSARPLPTPYARGPQPANALPGATGTGQVVVRLFFTKDVALVPVERRVTAKPNIDELVHTLLAGPTRIEQDSGIGSALLGNDVITGVSVSRTLATVELAATQNETGRTDDILALAQIVCTLTARAEINGVYFVHNGRRVGIPRADGSLSEGPLTLADYIDLLIA